MTNLEELAERVEAATPARWIAFLASIGVWFLFTGLAAFLHANGFSEDFEEIVGRLGLVAAGLTWWEVRRPKYVAAALRARSQL